MKKVLVIIPAFNEEKSIENTLKEVLKCKRDLEKRFLLQIDLIVIDDGSRDNTARVAQKYVPVIRHPVNLGYWPALQTGMIYGWERGYDFFITMDADGQHIPSEIEKLLIPLLREERDLVIGAYPERGNFLKKLAWKFFKLLTGLSIEDLTSGFRGYTLNAISYLISSDYLIFDNADLATLLILKTQKCSFKEVKVKIRERGEGKSKLFSTPFKIAKYMIFSVIICLTYRNYK